MKKVHSGTFIAISLISGIAFGANAQMGGPMMGSGETIVDDHTAEEEAEGKAIWEKLQAKEIGCDKLSEDDFGALGEYFMGTMMGDAHPAMNAMMVSMMGEEGEEQVHVVMGERLSGCDTEAAYPLAGRGFMPMMQMFGGGWGSGGGWGRGFGPMMGVGLGTIAGFGLIAFLIWILWWALVIAGIVAVLRWLLRRFGALKSSALDTLKERYARGEISKSEFEEKKKDLSV